MDGVRALAELHDHDHGALEDASSTTCALGIPDICQQTPEALFEMHRNFLMFFSIFAMLAFMAGSALHHTRCAWYPETLLMLNFGGVLGFVLLAVHHDGHLDQKLIRVILQTFLKAIALPIIIFDAGWAVRRRDFVSQLGYILLFGVLGTAISIAVTAVLMKLTAALHFVNSWRTCFAYASLISAVEPVPALATFAEVGVDPLLSIIVLGSSLVSEAFSVMVFQSANYYGLTVAELVLKTGWTFFGSILLGVTLAIIFLLCIRKTRMGDAPHNAILFLLCSALFSYSFADFIKLSGVVAVLFQSMVMGTYVPYHLGADSTSLASFLLKQAASMMDTMVFLFIGVMGIYVIPEKETHGLGLASKLFVICIVSRACAVVPLGLLSNLIKRAISAKVTSAKQLALSKGHIFMLWHSCTRGGISLLLVLQLGDWVDVEEGEHARQELINATYIVIWALMLVFGSTTSSCLRHVGLPTGDQVTDVSLHASQDRHAPLWRCLTWVKADVLGPVLIGHVGHVDRGTVQSADDQVQENSPAAEYQKRSQSKSSVENGAVQHRTRRPSFSNISEVSADDSLHRMAMGRAATNASCWEKEVAGGRSGMHALFGTSDPAHFEEVEDIIVSRVTSEQSHLARAASEVGSPRGLSKASSFAEGAKPKAAEAALELGAEEHFTL